MEEFHVNWNSIIKFILHVYIYHILLWLISVIQEHFMTLYRGADKSLA
jgi:hypothetical protein